MTPVRPELYKIKYPRLQPLLLFAVAFIGVLLWFFYLNFTQQRDVYLRCAWIILIPTAGMLVYVLWTVHWQIKVYPKELEKLAHSSEMQSRYDWDHPEETEQRIDAEYEKTRDLSRFQ